MPDDIWARLLGRQDDGPPAPRLWWQTQTPLAADMTAAEGMQMPIDTYYRTTSWKIRLLHRFHALYRQEQEQAAHEHAEQVRETQQSLSARIAQARR